MRYKVVPEPRSLEFLAAAQRAVPLVPGTEEDCCARLMDRTAVTARDDAREWLTFLEALELVESTERGYRRRRRSVEPGTVAGAFRQRVYAADAVLDALADADGPVSAATVFETVRETVPAYERRRYDDWEGVWRDRVGRLLGWAVRFGLAVEADGGYAPAG